MSSNSEKKIIVAIDGHSSCGKSTMAKKLAREAGYIYVDTGAMYRAVGLFCLRKGWIVNGVVDAEAVQRNIQEIELKFIFSAPGKAEIMLNGENVEALIRTLEVANAASKISALPAVRHELVRQQQIIGRDKGIVMDGRDIGTVVFPDAELKVFLTATAEVRARRRFDEMVSKGENPAYEDVLANVVERDDRDTHRAESPLRPADDAVVIDNSELSPDEQQEVLRKLFSGRLVQ